MAKFQIPKDFGLASYLNHGIGGPSSGLWKAPIWTVSSPLPPPHLTHARHGVASLSKNKARLRLRSNNAFIRVSGECASMVKSCGKTKKRESKHGQFLLCLNGVFLFPQCSFCNVYQILCSSRVL